MTISVDGDFYRDGERLVKPFDPANVNPASLDLRLGNQIRVPDPVWKHLNEDALRCLIQSGAINHIPQWTPAFTFESHWLMPGDFVLCHSLEHTTLSADEIGLLFLKSSAGRIGLEHSHAGFGDPSFAGQWTWELSNIAPWPVELKPGARLMQIVVIKLVDASEKGYDLVGSFQGQTGPTTVEQRKQR